MSYTLEGRKNRQEQNKIRAALAEAIPEGISYENLIIVLAELLASCTREMTMARKRVGEDDKE